METNRSLWQHQTDGINAAKNLDCYALFYEPGCLSWDTELKINRGGGSKIYTIEKLYRLFNSTELQWNERGFSDKNDTKIRAYKDGIFKLVNVVKVFRNGVKPLYKLSLKINNFNIKATLDHKFLTKEGWKELRDITKNDFVAIDLTRRYQKKKELKKVDKPYYQVLAVGEFHKYARKCHRICFSEKKNKKVSYIQYKVEKHRLIYEAAFNGLDILSFIEKTYKPNNLKFIAPTRYHIHHKDHNSLNNNLDNLQKLSVKEHLKQHGDSSHFGHGKVSWSKVKSVDFVGDEICYDIETESPISNYVANNITVHNCGKTATAVSILRNKFNENKKILPTLIFCPPVVVSNWVREIQMWSKVPRNKIVPLTGTGVQRLKTLLAADQSSIFITNYEALLMPALYKEFIKILGNRPSCLVLDESHKIKSVSSKRTKLMIELSDFASYRYLLSGTPILNNLMDIFSQFRVLDGGKRFGTNFFSFRARYFEDRNRGMPSARHFPDWRLIRGSEETVKNLMQEISMHVKKEDCLTLPPLVRKIIEVEMGKEQAKLYKSMKDDLISTINCDDGKDRHSIAELAITKALRLSQIVSGHLKVEGENGEDGKTITIKENPRKEALRELLEDLAPNHKVLVWAVYHANYADIREVCDDLKIKYAEIHGLVKSKDAEAERFRTDESVRVMIGHPGSGGIGINLVEASYMIYYSRSFSLEFDLQSEARNYRGGSERHKSITRIDLVCPNTIDELVLKSLAAKISLSNSVLKSHLGEI